MRLQHIIEHLADGKSISSRLIGNKTPDVLKATGLSTKREVVELGLKMLVSPNKQQAISKLLGKLKWEGD